MATNPIEEVRKLLGDVPTTVVTPIPKGPLTRTERRQIARAKEFQPAVYTNKGKSIQKNLNYLREHQRGPQ